MVDDACRGVSEENIKRTKMELTSMGALILQSEDVSVHSFTYNLSIHSNNSLVYLCGTLIISPTPLPSPPLLLHISCLHSFPLIGMLLFFLKFQRNPFKNLPRDGL
mgnify:CR=1 FL=1